MSNIFKSISNFSKNILHSGFQLSDYDKESEWKLANANFMMILAMIISPILGLLHLTGRYGFDSHIHAAVCFIFSAIQMCLILNLRRSLNNLKAVSHLAILSTFLVFTSNLFFSINDGTRLVWFIILFFAADVLCGSKVRNATILATCILFVFYFGLFGANANISSMETSMSFLVIALMFVLFMFYDRKIKNLLGKLKEQKIELSMAKEHSEATNRELRNALDEVNQLSGMLPICASCKKIRDDKGYWNQIEFYIRNHSEAEFSHSICPDCVKELYPDLETHE